jgi:hypothetical protein
VIRRRRVVDHVVARIVGAHESEVSSSADHRVDEVVGAARPIVIRRAL